MVFSIKLFDDDDDDDGLGKLIFVSLNRIKCTRKKFFS